MRISIWSADWIPSSQITVSRNCFESGELCAMCWLVLRASVTDDLEAEQVWSIMIITSYARTDEVSS
jgi:hypothetical protein